MNVKFLKSGEKKKLFSELDEKFGIDKVNYLLFETGKDKIRGYSGHLTREEIMELGEIANVEIIGMYLFKKEVWGVRLSHDAVHAFSDKIKKGIFSIGKEDFDKWIRGNDIDVKCDKGAVILKYGDDFVGCGVSNGEKIFNYVPNERRIRSRG